MKSRAHNILYLLPPKQRRTASRVVEAMKTWDFGETETDPAIRSIKAILRRPYSHQVRSGFYKHTIVHNGLAFKVTWATEQFWQELELWRGLRGNPLQQHLATPFYVSKCLQIQEAVKGQGCRIRWEGGCNDLMTQILEQGWRRESHYIDGFHNHRHIKGRGPVWFDYAL